jgi:ABC-type lipoprotein export system ATPase subunit
VLECFGATRQSLRVLADSGVTCVLVEGPSGCGKTARLLELAASYDRHPGDGLLYLHLGEQIDGKVKGGRISQCTQYCVKHALVSV